METAMFAETDNFQHLKQLILKNWSGTADNLFLLPHVVDDPHPILGTAAGYPDKDFLSFPQSR
jgi:hypothetical protein